MNSPRVLFAAIVLGYAVLGLVVLSPAAVYSGDIGVKFVQARALVAHRFASMNIPYPGEFLDPDRQFSPLREPFILKTAGGTQAIFSPASAVVQALGVGVLGLHGMIAISLVAGAWILYSAWQLADPRDARAVLVALGLAGPLWFYAISGWEHAPAVALGTAAFLVAVRSTRGAAPLLAGLLVGAGATLRDEIVLLVPGLLLVVWFRRQRFVPLVALAAGATVSLGVALLLEVVWFDRPVAAHLRHAVHLVQSAAHLTSEPNPDVPELAVMTLRQRYEAVVWYWLLGYGRDRWIAAFALGLAAALVVRWRWRSSVGLVMWVAGVLVLAAMDAWELLTAPKWLAGLHRVSPYLVFAILPAPRESPPGSWLPRAVLFTTVAYLVIAFAGTDTSGGKSLGPRLLLPLFPLLTVVAVARIREYLDAPASTDRAVGRAGVTLAILCIAMHLGGTIRAYVKRNQQDAAVVRAVGGMPGRIVVTDDMFTAQGLFPLYYRKIVLLADSAELGTRLGSALAEHRLRSVVVVTRRPGTSIDLPPFRKWRTEMKGRMTIQYWLR
jgi:hypothetical protein